MLLASLIFYSFGLNFSLCHNVISPSVLPQILCVALALLCLVDLFEQVQLHVVGEARAPAHLLAPAFRFMAMVRTDYTLMWVFMGEGWADLTKLH